MICCLDLEGVLVPEIWINVSRKTGIEALKRTTRDEPDYDVLMTCRLKILRDNGIKLKDIQNVISKLKPLAGARKFLDDLRRVRQVIILSDTYYEFAGPLMKGLGYPALFCNRLETDEEGFIKQYYLRQKDGKKNAVAGLKNLGFEVAAVGDSYNDLSMLKEANRGILFRPPETIRKAYPEFPAVQDHRQLLRKLI